MIYELRSIASSCFEYDCKRQSISRVNIPKMLSELCFGRGLLMVNATCNGSPVVADKDGKKFVVTCLNKSGACWIEARTINPNDILSNKDSGGSL
ncbi:MAG: hypothetical protein LHW64_00445 [Candidatus Cloacimonetes bacterium]|nr:hypothetical protein [Candidatus Cloacimonadota bacterium]MCB5286257.1 hypothetical protein [Candidatus Cloacimonadota bacterium]MCK9184511.1 hypothetical protein [Candidatus Cloacimonadota bacterium]MCK9584075.1 hypothetical protein [Candidatus Cloacimonadota bacterium]MDY0228579.1 hypothetical protein [Candidatus Cloacimonadaceae bacterium]